MKHVIKLSFVYVTYYSLMVAGVITHEGDMFCGLNTKYIQQNFMNSHWHDQISMVGILICFRVTFSVFICMITFIAAIVLNLSADLHFIFLLFSIEGHFYEFPRVI
jgi:hypothetical protein